METKLTLKQILIVQAIAMVFLGTIFDSLVRGAVDQMKNQNMEIAYLGSTIYSKINECKQIAVENTRYIDEHTGGKCLNVR